MAWILPGETERGPWDSQELSQGSVHWKCKLCVFSLEMTLWTRPLRHSQQDQADRHPAPKQADGHPRVFPGELNPSRWALNYKETEAPVSVNGEMPLSKNVKCHEKRKFPRILLLFSLLSLEALPHKTGLHSRRSARLLSVRWRAQKCEEFAPITHFKILPTKNRFCKTS